MKITSLRPLSSSTAATDKAAGGESIRGTESQDVAVEARPTASAT